MLRLLSVMLTWWNGATVGTWLHTHLYGERVGWDEFGNVYYRSRGDRRRWVVFEGESEASKVPPAWRFWLHRTTDESPRSGTRAPLYAWQQSHLENRTGLADAYRPSGSLHRGAKRPKATGDYEAWQPGSTMEDRDDAA